MDDKFTAKDIADTIEIYNEKMASPNIVPQDEIDAIKRSAEFLIGFSYSLCKRAGVSFSTLMVNVDFDRFLFLYGEFCYHYVKRELDNTEINETLTRLGLSN